MNLETTLERAVVLLGAYHKQLDKLENSVRKAWSAVKKGPFPVLNTSQEDLNDFRKSFTCFRVRIETLSKIIQVLTLDVALETPHRNHVNQHASLIEKSLFDPTFIIPPHDFDRQCKFCIEEIKSASNISPAMDTPPNPETISTALDGFEAQSLECMALINGIVKSLPDN